jgi:NAD(P)-dependent dehydrogenase (short-subunit alcohol dehydrogenase family)
VWAERAAAVAAAEGIGQEAAEQLILERQDMGHTRWGTAQEIADVVVFLLSAQAAFVNGQSLRVDRAQFPAVSS